MYSQKLTHISPQSEPRTRPQQSAAAPRIRRSDRAEWTRDAIHGPGERLAGTVLSPVRWVVLLGIVASLHVRFGLKIDRAGLATAAAVYAVVAVVLPRLHLRSLTPPT